MAAPCIIDEPAVGHRHRHTHPCLSAPRHGETRPTEKSTAAAAAARAHTEVRRLLERDRVESEWHVGLPPPRTLSEGTPPPAACEDATARDVLSWDVGEERTGNRQVKFPAMHRPRDTLTTPAGYIVGHWSGGADHRAVSASVGRTVLLQA